MRRLVAPVFLALALSACASAPTARNAETSASGPRLEGIPVTPPFGYDVHMIPSGDPAARHLPDVLPEWFEPRAYYRLNADPVRRYRITGRIPPHYDVEFGSDFVAYGMHTPQCQAILHAGGREPSSAVQTQVPLSVRRLAPDRYEATLVIDRMDDDSCRWVYQSTRMRIVDRNLPAPSGPFYYPNGEPVSADRYHLPESAPRCRPAPYAGACREAWSREVSSSSDTPVLIRCRVRATADRNPNSYLYCGDPLIAYKRTQLLVPDTGAIAVDLYDIGIEPDPIDPTSFPPELRSE